MKYTNELTTLFAAGVLQLATSQPDQAPMPQPAPQQCVGYYGGIHDVGGQVRLLDHDHCLNDNTLVIAIDICTDYGDYVDWEIADAEMPCGEGEHCVMGTNSIGSCVPQPTASPTVVPSRMPTPQPTVPQCDGYNGGKFDVGDQERLLDHDHCLNENTLIIAIDICSDYGDYVDWEIADTEMPCGEGMQCVMGPNGIGSCVPII